MYKKHKFWRGDPNGSHWLQASTEESWIRLRGKLVQIWSSFVHTSRTCRLKVEHRLTRIRTIEQTGNKYPELHKVFSCLAHIDVRFDCLCQRFSTTPPPNQSDCHLFPNLKCLPKFSDSGAFVDLVIISSWCKRARFFKNLHKNARTHSGAFHQAHTTLRPDLTTDTPACLTTYVDCYIWQNNKHRYQKLLKYPTR